MSAIQYPIPICTIQPLRDGVAVLRALFNSRYTMSAEQISSAVGMEYSQVEKLLYTLQVEGMAECDKLGQWSIHKTGLMAAFLKEGQR